MTEPSWIDKSVVLRLHDGTLARHGGLPGLRDEGALDSALARPINRFAYGESDLAVLAAAYGFGIARNHPFADGNKRTSAITTILFLRLNGVAFAPSNEAVADTWLALAAGTLDEAALAAWLRDHVG